MIEFTGVDPYTYRYETWRVSVLLSNVSHVAEYTGRETKCGAIIYMMNGTKVYVSERIGEVQRRLNEVFITAADRQRDAGEGSDA